LLDFVDDTLTTVKAQKKADNFKVLHRQKHDACNIDKCKLFKVNKKDFSARACVASVCKSHGVKLHKYVDKQTVDFELSQTVLLQFEHALVEGENVRNDVYLVQHDEEDEQFPEQVHFVERVEARNELADAIACLFDFSNCW